MTRRIALISDHASPLAAPGSVDSGGQNIYVGQIARHLAANGYGVDIFTRRDRPDLAEVYAWEPRIRIIHVPAGPATFVEKERLLPYMAEFARHVLAFAEREASPYDLMHANFFMSGWVACQIRRHLRIPYVVTFHALGKVRQMYQQSADKFPRERIEIEHEVMREADQIIAECPQDREDLMHLYQVPLEKITMVPCGFDPQEFWPIAKRQARKMLGLAQDERIILQLGRMVPRKGVQTAIEGLARLIGNHGINARLLVVGGGSRENDPHLCEEIRRLRGIARARAVSKRVTFTGCQPRHLLKYYYSAADIFVTTPWYEPFGITPLEAMACGTPVIGSRVGGIKHTVLDGHTGFLIPPKDPNALAERLTHLFQHPEILHAMRRAALKRVHALFTWEQVAQALGALYEDVIEHNAPAFAAPGNYDPVHRTRYPRPYAELARGAP